LVERNKIFFFLTNLRFFKSTPCSAVKAVSPKGAETEQGAKLGNRLGKDNMHRRFSTAWGWLFQLLGELCF